MRAGPLPRTLGLLLFLVALHALARAEDTRWDELIQAGNTAMQEKKFAQAEKYFREALAEASTGDPHDPKIIDSLQALATLHHAQGKLLAEEPFLRRLLQLREDELGPASPEVVPAILGLAFLYGELQRPSDAEPLLRRALEIRESTLGPTDDQTLNLVTMLGLTCRQLRKYTEAEELFRRSLQAHQDMQPPDRDAAAHDLLNLSSVSSNQGREAEAEALMRQAKEYGDSTGVGGAGGSGVMDRRLAISFWMQKRFAEAEPLLLHWLETEEKTMGPNHPNVLCALSDLESFYHAQGRDSEARTFAQRAAAIASKLQEEDKNPEKELADWDAHIRLTNAASTLMNQGEFSRAEELYLQALSALKKSGQAPLLTVAGAIMSVGNAKCFQGKYEEAVLLFKQSVEMAEKAMGRDAPQVIANYRPWGQCHARVGKYAEADSFYRQLIQRLDKPGNANPGALLGVLGDYIRLLQRTDREAEAAQFKDRFERIRSQLREENSAPQ